MDSTDGLEAMISLMAASSLGEEAGAAALARRTRRSVIASVLLRKDLEELFDDLQDADTCGPWEANTSASSGE